MLTLRPHQQRALDAMLVNSKGQIIVPTGGGKTICMIEDCRMIMSSLEGKSPTIIVVAPRIMLAEQLSSEFLEFITDANVMHVHSGETHHFSSTKPHEIRGWWKKNNDAPRIIFTTYNSLRRVVEAHIPAETIYFDEAHNSVKKNFFPAVEHYSAEADRCFFFTATPKHSATFAKPGMNDAEVYGQVIEQVPAPELVEGGFILPPKVVVQELKNVGIGQTVPERDCDHLLESIDGNENMQKVLICAKKTKDIINVVSQSPFIGKMHEKGYSVMWITSKHGAFIDGQKVDREKFFDTMNEWGRDKDKKFVVMHHSILSEGINVHGLSACIMLRGMDYIEIAQTVGRVIRLGEGKTFGLVNVPVFGKVGISTAQKVQKVVDIIFEQGDAAISTIRR
jgi:superfamily II DNA or RNA helicase